MISHPERQQIMQWVEAEKATGARCHKACELLGIAPRALQRWRASTGETMVKSPKKRGSSGFSDM